jgi:hypothetical protein
VGFDKHPRGRSTRCPPNITCPNGMARRATW